MGNSRNLANLLGTGSTIATAKIADDAITVDKIADTSRLGRRRMTINGAMTVSQRGTGFNSQTTSHYCVDRYQVEITTAGTWSTSQSTTSPDGFGYSLKLDCTTADSSLGSGDLVRIIYKFEGQDLQHLQYGDSTAKDMVLSFWVRTNKTGTYTIQFQQADNGYKQIAKSFVVNSADTWEQKEITIPGDTSGVINNDNGEGLRICWVLAAGSTFTGGSERTTWTTFANADVAATQTVNIADSTSNEFFLTGVQLELGSSKTDFEYRTYGEELELCSRYFQIIQKGNDKQICHGGAYSAGQVEGTVNFHPQLRGGPTLFYISASGYFNSEQMGGHSRPFTEFTGMFRNNKQATGIYKNSLDGFTANAVVRISTNNTNAFIGASSEI